MDTYPKLSHEKHFCISHPAIVDFAAQPCSWCDGHLLHDVKLYSRLLHAQLPLTTITMINHRKIASIMRICAP